MTETEPTETEIPADLSTLTVPQLREIADAADLAVPKSAPKPVLVEAIEEYRARVRETVDAAVERAVTTEEVEGEATEETDEPLPDDAAEAESRALALREEPVVQEAALLPTTGEFDAMLAISTKIANTQMVPTAYRGKPDDVLAAILTGREMGLGPMQSLREIYVIDGKPSLSANLLLARMRSGGLIIEASESTAERAWARVRNRATGEVVEEEWTIEEARVAKTRERGQTISLADKNTFRNYPKDMLWARLVGRIARRFPDLIGAVMPYSSEEVQDWDDAPAADSGATTPTFGSDKRAGQWVAPADWGELSRRITEQLGDDDSAAWMEELAEKAYQRPSLADVVQAPEAEVPGDRKRDLWQRLNVVLRGLEEAERPVDGVGLRMTPGVRKIVQGIVYEAFDKTVALLGPSWALDPVEAETMPQRDGTPPPPSAPQGEAVGGDLPAETAPAAETSSETPEAESGAEDAPDAASEAAVGEPGDDVGGIKF